MKKEAVKIQKKEVKPVVNVKRNPSKQGNMKKSGGPAVKKIATSMKHPPAQQLVDTATVPTSSETGDCKNSTEQVEVVAEIKLTEIAESPPEHQTTDDITNTIPKESKVLRERLGLNGYCTETIKLSTPIEVLGCKAEGVVFAKQIEGVPGVPVDRILLHVTLISATGKRSIVSSRKKVPQPEWQALTDVLSSQAITWRDRESKRVAK